MKTFARVKLESWDSWLHTGFQRGLSKNLEVTAKSEATTAWKLLWLLDLMGHRYGHGRVCRSIAEQHRKQNARKKSCSCQQQEPELELELGCQQIVVALRETAPSSRHRTNPYWSSHPLPELARIREELQQHSQLTLQWWTGNLAIRGITKTVSLPVQFTDIAYPPGADELADFETHFALDRAEYGVLGARWGACRLALSKEVETPYVSAACTRCRE